MKLAARALLALGSTALYLGLAVLGIGGLGAYLSHPPLVALAVIFATLSLAAVFAGGNVSRGVREDRGNRWVIVAVVAIALAAGFVPAWTDRIGFWTIDGDAVRWCGVALAAVGATLRVAPIFVLGKRFSGLVAIQPGHTLVTTGLYAVIRHPSYLGLLVGSLGWGLAFRSGVGILLTLLFVAAIAARITSEEALLHLEFGAEYDAYRARTWRLIPLIY